MYYMHFEKYFKQSFALFTANMLHDLSIYIDVMDP